MGEVTRPTRRWIRRPARFIFRDDSGTPVDVVRRRMGESPTANVRRRITGSAVPVVLAIVGVVMGVISCAGPALPLLMHKGETTGLERWIVAAAAVGAMGLVLFVGWLLVREWLGRLDWELITTRRAADMCGQCGFSLRGLPPSADGCVGCPECSARWRPTPIPGRQPGADTPLK